MLMAPSATATMAMLLLGAAGCSSLLLLLRRRRHRILFGHYGLSGNNFASKFFSNWTLAPLIELSSGRPFNIITGGGDNLQQSALTSRPNIVAPGTPANACGYSTVASRFSPSGFFQEPWILNFNGTLASLDGNLGRNAGTTPWTVFNDMRVARKIYLGERFNLDLIADTFNIANRFNVGAVSPLLTNAGQATSAYDPRQFQFAVKLNW